MNIYYGENLRPALEPLLVVLTKHFFDKNCKIIFVSTSTSGPLMFEKLRSLASNIFAVKRYGFDYVFLGKIDYDQKAVASLATSIHQTLDKDYYNNSVTDYVKLPIMKNVDEAEDFAAVFILSIETEIFECTLITGQHWGSTNNRHIESCSSFISELHAKWASNWNNRWMRCDRRI